MLKKRGNQRVNEGETFNVSSNIHNINRAHRQKLLLLLISHKLCCSLFVIEREREREFAIFLVVVSFVLPFIHSSSSRSTKRIYASQAVSARQRAKWKNNKNIEFDAGKSKHTTTTTLCTSSRLFAKIYI